MSFETIVGIMLSALIPKVFENIQLKRGVITSKVLKMLLIMFVIWFIWSDNNIITGFIRIPEIEKYYQAIVSNFYFKLCTLIVIGLLLLISYSRKSNADFCTYHQLVKKIIGFTDKAITNSILYILCGDMDVAWDFSKGEPEEFKQLKSIVKEVQEIRILCKHGMRDDLIEEIKNDSYDIEKIVEDTRSNKNQLERINRFKKELGDKCVFRFYDRDKDDFSNLRARVIVSDKGKDVLVYECNRITKKRIYSFFRDKFSNHSNMIDNIERRSDYSYEYCDFSEMSYSLQKRHYIELCEMKWTSCNKRLGKQIETYSAEYVSRKEGKNKKEKYMIKKIAFIYAKTYEAAHFKERRKEFPPFGVMYLAAMVQRNCKKWEPSIIAIEEGNFEIDINKYDIIAFSVISAYTVPLFEKCMSDLQSQKNSGRESRRNCLCIAGGYQAELELQNWLKKKWVKFVLSGEGERTIVSILNNYSENAEKIKSIAGISYINNNGEIIQNYNNVECLELDEIPFPARELLAEEDYIMTDRLAGTRYKMVHVLFSRGCIKNCFYCGVPKGGNNSIVRYRSAENIVKELEELKIKGIEGFSIIDDCFLTNQEKAIEIIREVGKVDMKWSLAARVDQINEEVVKELEKANCLEVKFGIETGSDELLKRMNKQCTVEDAKKAIRIVREHKINVKAFIITGLPFETKSTNEETKQFLREMGRDNINRISLLRFVPLPGSHIFNHPEEFGLKSDFAKNTSYTSYKLYGKTTGDWWKDNQELKLRDEIYEDIRNFMLKIWNEI